MSSEEKYKSFISKQICPWLKQPFGKYVNVNLKGDVLTVCFEYPVEKNYKSE